MAYDVADAYGDTANLPLEPFWVDTTAGTMTHEAQTGAWPTLTNNSLIESKFVWVEQLQCLLMVPTAASNVLIRKF
jgi:hypothetical protein